MSQFLVLFRALGEVMTFFRVPQFSCPMHFNRMVRHLCDTIAPQTLRHQVSTFHPVACVKRAMFEKYARTFMVENVKIIMTTPKMIRSHKDERAKTQTEINP